MKTLYLVGGTMGVGKTTVCQQLKKEMNNSVFLDGDWCWDASPFRVTEETKAMVTDNIRYLLNNFIACSAYENIIFCWVMHEQSIIDSILDTLNLDNVNVKCISLMCNDNTLRSRLGKDIQAGIRTPDVLDRSLARLEKYSSLNTTKINTDGKTVNEIAAEIIQL